MTRPEELQARLQEWADQFDNRNQAAEALSAELGCALGTARGYIDYRISKATYEDAYRVWQVIDRALNDVEWM